jgi:hypothetical protein
MAPGVIMSAWWYTARGVGSPFGAAPIVRDAGGRERREIDQHYSRGFDAVRLAETAEIPAV